jgi:transposase InsO family protein
VPPSAQEVAIKHRIDEVYTACPFYGSRRITAQLVREGMTINHKTVQRHMREMGIAGVSPGPNLSQRRKDHAVYPYLLRGVVSSHPNHIWGIDITYIRLQKHWMYLVAVMDWYSRYVVSWQLDDIGHRFRVGQRGCGAGAQLTADLQQRSGQPVHQPAIHPTPACGRYSDQHGWQGGRSGQHLHRTVVAHDQI